MSENGRKASDMLLEMEATLKSVLDLVRNLDLNNKIISNKLNALIQANKDASHQMVEKPKFTVEAVDKTLPIQAPISKVSPVETDPTGFRRTSRPETYAGDDSFFPKKKESPVKMQEEPTFIMKPPQEIIEEVKREQPVSLMNNSENKLPVTQRVIDKNGKAVFLADVEIFNSETNELAVKLRTNGVGKWAASLLPDTYTVVISKREAVNKEKTVSKQTVLVDGFVSPLELQPVILK